MQSELYLGLRIASLYHSLNSYHSAGRPAGTIGKNNTRKGVRYAKSAYL